MYLAKSVLIPLKLKAAASAAKKTTKQQQQQQQKQKQTNKKNNFCLWNYNIDNSKWRNARYYGNNQIPWRFRYFFKRVLVTQLKMK